MIQDIPVFRDDPPGGKRSANGCCRNCIFNCYIRRWHCGWWRTTYFC